MGRQGLEVAAVHEIKPQLGEPDASPSLNWAASWSAARGFLIALMARRLRSLAQRTVAPAPVLWCCPKVFAQELGGPYAAGFAAYGIRSESLIIVEPTRAQDVLWAMEEGLKSHAVACVVGILDDVAMTPARRLALAAQKHRVPCLALTHPRAPPMPATATRWRIAPAPSRAHPVRAGLPGNLSLTLGLERRRADPLAGPVTAVTVEWCHETLSFGLVDDVCDRSFARNITSPFTRPLGQRRSG